VFVVLAVLMVTTLPYAKFSQFKRIPRLLWVLVAGVLVVNTQLGLFAIELTYLLSGPFLWWRGRHVSTG
jgi:phosphatidylserine synthase